jgi:hyperosmotically inducible periplasmic protein
LPATRNLSIWQFLQPVEDMQLCCPSDRAYRTTASDRDPEQRRTTTVTRYASHSDVRRGDVAMLITRLRPALLLCSTSLLTTTLALSGCHENQHPDYRMAVYSALDQNNLRSITVSQDRGAGTITLSGIVGSMDRRQQAESIAKQAAPGYQVADRIEVKEAGLHDDIQAATQKAQLDSAIEDNFKARLSDEPSLKSEKIQYTAFHGTLTLKGTVRNTKERQQAEDLARKVPQVQHVVNQLQVHPGKPSPANS